MTAWPPVQASRGSRSARGYRRRTLVLALVTGAFVALLFLSVVALMTATA